MSQFGNLVGTGVTFWTTTALSFWTFSRWVLIIFSSLRYTSSPGECTGGIQNPPTHVHIICMYARTIYIHAACTTRDESDDPLADTCSNLNLPRAIVCVCVCVIAVSSASPRGIVVSGARREDKLILITPWRSLGGGRGRAWAPVLWLRQ